ncbi:MAG: bacteriocin/lantibiotic ABC transporter ATP-binding protein [bacterium P3]|nr:MAG: bacteriocin/lantibiotic ABC transporter ATP-binding protein [bacterium P3]
MNKGVKIKQHDITDCGAACLASISAFYGLQLPISKIRQMASTDRKGTNVLGLIEAARKLGFDVKAVKSILPDGKNNVEPLSKIPTPAIAHVIKRGKLLHYEVIYGVKQDKIRIMDPGTGELEWVPMEVFNSEWTGVLVLLMPKDDFEKGDKKVSMLKRFSFLLKPHKRAVIESIFGAVIYTLLGLATSIYVGKIVDYVIPDGNGNLLNLLSVLMLVILVLSLFIDGVKTVYMLKTGIKIDTRLILGYYKHLLRLPQSFFDSMRSGEIISRVNDAVKIRSFINETLVGLMVNIFTVIFAFALMFTYYWKLAVIMLLIIPLYVVLYLLYNRVNRVILRKGMEQAAELNAQLVESINTAGTVKRFGLEEYEDIKTENRFVTYIRTVYKSSINALWANLSSGGISRLFTIILLWAGTYFVLDNIITSGELMSFYSLISYFIGPIASLIGINRVYQDAKIAASRLFEIMDLDVEEVEGKIRFEKEQVGDIAFEHVDFRYGTRTEVFKDFSVTFRKGQISAIVGESGSGKTTLAALMQNLYELQNGHIRIGGVDVRHIDNADLRSLVCVVPQRIDLFEGTIQENITLDDYDSDNARVLELCKEVGLLEFIEGLPMGFNTNIGENGVQLSGGQRQRLAIIRALYRNPEILVLDEATSSLDSESEKSIKRIVAQLRSEGKTVLLIAHRLGTVMDADEIFVLKEGTLIEQGTHQGLISRDGEYAKFWRAQTIV